MKMQKDCATKKPFSDKKIKGHFLLISFSFLNVSKLKTPQASLFEYQMKLQLGSFSVKKVNLIERSIFLYICNRIVLPTTRSAEFFSYDVTDVPT